MNKNLFLVVFFILFTTCYMVAQAEVKQLVFENAYSETVYNTLASTIKKICDFMPDKEICLRVSREGVDVILETNIPAFFKSPVFLCSTGIFGLLFSFFLIIRLCDLLEVKYLKKDPNSTISQDFLYKIAQCFSGT